ncbi:MAG: FAD-dependent oxidoreductase [Candidatus Bathyarchaeia archaeon]
MGYSNQFRMLFTPIELGPVKIRNRTYSPPHSLGYAEPVPGEPHILLPADRHADYFAERARGGIGLLIQESSPVHPSSDYLFQICLYDKRSIPGLGKIADAVHQHGGKIFMQLWHTGHHAHNFRTMQPALSASQSPDVMAFTIPKEMEVEDIHMVQEAFADSAAIVKAAGYDGFELHGTHSYLIEQFLSPFYNKRTDGYGGSTENRMRFVVEIFDCIRQKVGYDVALGMRMDSEEFLPGGLGLDETKEIAKKLEATGKIDYLDVDIATYHSLPIMIAPPAIGPLHIVDYIAEIKQAVNKIPILGCAGRLTNPLDAERILQEGKMDMVGSSRPWIAEPEWANKAFQGRLDDIIECTGCNACIARLFYNANAGVACSVNPVTGFEKEWGAGTLTKAARSRRILVVGGGPVGLEVARTAALRGHEVSLYEKKNELGGRLLLEGKLPGQETYLLPVKWYTNQLKKLCVNVKLGVTVTAATVESESFDAVVTATGASFTPTGISGFIPAPIKGWDQPSVVTPEQVISKEVKPGKNVLILDDESNVTAPAIAEMLADEGSTVEIVTRWNTVGVELFKNLQFGYRYPALYKKRVRMTPNTYVKEISPRAVTVFNIYTNEEAVRENVDNIVMVTAKRSDRKLCEELKGKVHLHEVGDCVAPRSLLDIVHDAHKLGREL